MDIYLLQNINKFLGIRWSGAHLRLILQETWKYNWLDDSLLNVNIKSRQNISWSICSIWNNKLVTLFSNHCALMIKMVCLRLNCHRSLIWPKMCIHIHVNWTPCISIILLSKLWGGNLFKTKLTYFSLFLMFISFRW